MKNSRRYSRRHSRTAALLLALLLTAVQGPTTAFAEGWVEDSCGSRYEYDDGTYATATWVRDGGDWYFVGKDGYRLENTFGPDGRYLDPSGVLVKNSGIDREYMKEQSAEGTVIVYNKYSHKVEVWSCGQFLYTCDAVSGREPGDKEIEGDGRTPEGEFYICNKNEKEKYYKGMGLSYPNLEDAERGLRQGLISRTQYNGILRALEKKQLPNWYTKLGGAIMIHGEKNNNDGSSGCISVDNKDMDILWSYAKVGTKVIILDTGKQRS